MLLAYNYCVLLVVRTIVFSYGCSVGSYDREKQDKMTGETDRSLQNGRTDVGEGEGQLEGAF